MQVMFFMQKISLWNHDFLINVKFWDEKVVSPKV